MNTSEDLCKDVCKLRMEGKKKKTKKLEKAGCKRRMRQAYIIFPELSLVF